MFSSKKICILLLLFFVIFIFVGCSLNDNNTSTINTATGIFSEDTSTTAGTSSDNITTISTKEGTSSDSTTTTTGTIEETFDFQDYHLNLENAVKIGIGDEPSPITLACRTYFINGVKMLDSETTEENYLIMETESGEIQRVDFIRNDNGEIIDQDEIPYLLADLYVYTNLTFLIYLPQSSGETNAALEAYEAMLDENNLDYVKGIRPDYQMDGDIYLDNDLTIILRSLERAYLYDSIVLILDNENGKLFQFDAKGSDLSLLDIEGKVISYVYGSAIEHLSLDSENEVIQETKLTTTVSFTPLFFDVNHNLIYESYDEIRMISSDYQTDEVFTGFSGSSEYETARNIWSAHGEDSYFLKYGDYYYFLIPSGGAYDPAEPKVLLKVDHSFQVVGYISTNMDMPTEDCCMAVVDKYLVMYDAFSWALNICNLETMAYTFLDLRAYGVSGTYNWAIEGTTFYMMSGSIVKVDLEDPSTDVLVSDIDEIVSIEAPFVWYQRANGLVMNNYVINLQDGEIFNDGDTLPVVEENVLYPIN